ncbi:MAG: Acyl-CoA dehydrogenase [Candidatus Heimdallarchaeota archaeon LC_2]|nr:MAG: Acyl-CoA dehydrogenase [Candidatus Heimdallarchaeota archaeon LC_2]
MLGLSEEQEMILETVRDLVNEKIKPRAQHYDNTGDFPYDNINDLADVGIIGMTVQEKYGGFGSDQLTYSAVIEEIARGCAATATTVAGTNSLAVLPIQDWGSEELKQKFLPVLGENTKLGSFALSEPQAGSDVAALKTRAEKEGDEYIINGSKIYITNAIVADLHIVFARSLPDPGYKGLSAFVVPANVDGVHVLPKEKKLGIVASPTSAMTFEEVRIPVENLIGEEGQGFKIALSTLNSGRIAVAAQSVGIAQAALVDGVKFAKQREQFNQSISKFQSIQMMLADMSTQTLSARLMYYHAAKLKDSGKSYIKEAAMAKLFASEAATLVSHKSIQIHGGSGFLKDFEVERYYRDARITEIYEGTSEIMRMIIAKEELR